MSPDNPMPDPERIDEAGEPEAGGVDHSAAVAALFRRKDNELKSYLARRLGSTEEARDVAQEAYAKLLALDKPDAPSILLYRLWAIARNLAKDRLKQRAVRRRVAPVAFFEPVVYTNPPESACVADERARLMQQALNELPARCHRVFMLRTFDGLTFEQIAERVGVDVRSAKRYVARALAHCQHVIGAAERQSP